MGIGSYSLGLKRPGRDPGTRLHGEHRDNLIYTAALHKAILVPVAQICHYGLLYNTTEVHNGKNAC